MKKTWALLLILSLLLLGCTQTPKYVNYDTQSATTQSSVHPTATQTTKNPTASTHATSPSPSVTDCGTIKPLSATSFTPLSCFAQATKNCGLAKIISSINAGAGDYDTSYETTGLEGSLCLVHAETIAAPDSSKGMYFDCKIKPAKLTEILNEWAQGQFSTSNGIPQNSESCTGPLAGN